MIEITAVQRQQPINMVQCVPDMGNSIIINCYIIGKVDKCYNMSKQDTNVPHVTQQKRVIFKYLLSNTVTNTCLISSVIQ